MNSKDFWALIVKLLTDLFAKWLNPIDPTLAPRMGAALIAATANLPAPAEFGAAPEELKQMIRKLITNLVNTSFSSRPIIRGLLLAVANNLPDSLIDKLWDSLFQDKLVSTPAPMRGFEATEVNPFVAAFNAEIG